MSKTGKTKEEKIMEGILKEITNKNGFNALIEILEFMKKHIPESKKLDYNSPIFIYRGVTKEWGSNNDSGEKSVCQNDPETKFIKSGAAVRLGKFKPGYNYTAYIDYIKGLVTNARQNFPDEYEGKCDLEILADIQHNGGGTCLVDFSKNLFVSLWFACNGDYDDEGVVYCYDIMKDIITNNQLSPLTKHSENKSIEDLLIETRKTANFRGKYSHKFWMWNPSCMNTRIFRQDSVFIFGLEKFNYEKHNFLEIRIHPQSKKAILYVLSTTFNLSATTIFHDSNGFADSNSKFQDFELYNSDPELEIYIKGFENMLSGNFAIALDFFNQCEIKKNEKKNVEIYYSKADCYRHLNIRENAILNYMKVKEIAKEKISGCKNINILLLTEEKKKEEKYWYEKFYKAAKRELFLTYELELFGKCFSICNEIRYQIEEYNKTIDPKEQDDDRYYKLAQLELYILKKLQEELQESSIKKVDNTNEINSQDYEKILQSLSKKEKTEKGIKNEFYIILQEYFNILNECYIKGLKINLESKLDLLDKKFDYLKDIKIEFYSVWDFTELKEGMYKLRNKSAGHKAEQLNNLLFITSKMEDIQNIIHSRYLKTNSDKEEKK